MTKLQVERKTAFSVCNPTKNVAFDPIQLPRGNVFDSRNVVMIMTYGFSKSLAQVVYQEFDALKVESVGQ